jgi:hypothetical protein
MTLLARTSGTSFLTILRARPFGDGRLAHARIADEQRIVLLAAAENLDRAFDFGFAADERIDFSRLGLFVQIDAIGFKRFGALLDDFLAFFFLFGAAHGLLLRHAGTLGDAVADIAHRIEPGHVLLLQEIDRVAFAFGEQRHQHIGACHFVAAGILDMQHGPLHDALEAGRGLGVLAVLDHQRDQLFVDIFDEGLAQRVDIDIAGLHHLRRVGIVEQSQQQVLQSRVFVMPVAREFNGAMKSLFQAPRQRRHRIATPSPWCTAEDVDGGGRIQ